ncbi:hypothetical protein GCM10023080_088040 [Streptomyces pseudoechinosporeus]
MECVAVAFDGKALRTSLDHQVDPVPAHRVLGTYPVAALTQGEEDPLLEEAVERLMPLVRAHLAEAEAILLLGESVEVVEIGDLVLLTGRERHEMRWGLQPPPHLVPL